MSLRKYLKKIFKKTIYEKKTLFLYEYDPVKQGDGQFDPEVKVFTEFNEIQKPLRKKILPYPLINPLYYRIKHHKATLLIIHKETELCAFGWNQSCEFLLKNDYCDFAPDSLILGPYWTSPDYRGKGLYGRLLMHSLALIDKKRHILISTRDDNFPSQRGIEKAGFKLIGKLQTIVILYYFRKKTKKYNVIDNNVIFSK